MYGTDRSLLLHVALALGKLSDPNPYWVDIRNADRAGEPSGPVALGRIPGDHLYIVSEAEARPENAQANGTLWTVVRSDEPAPEVAEFTDFLRLPRTVQEAVSRSGSEGRRPVFVFANTDRVRPYYPTTAADVRPIVDAMVRAGVTPIFAATGPPGAGRWAFDFVFEVRADPTHDRRGGSLVCERAPPGLSVATGQVIPFGRVPGLLQELSAG